ncbi:hypothetical protein ACFQ07_33650 [Actinomadura adrarensis]|uniref:Uncharacterized protein n=1 Tax=Actinomadura adrarensis TaxID=1819600 RepID=A0ABW3CTV2_9ACTN
MRRYLKRFGHVRHGGASEPPVPPALAVIVPEDLADRELVQGMERALAHSRDVLAEQALQARSLAKQESGDQVRRAYMTGRADALAEAVACTDDAVANVFEEGGV